MNLLDKIIFEFLEEHADDNQLTLNKDDYSIEEYLVGELEGFYTVFYKEEVIGSVLKYKKEIVLTGYYKTDGDKKPKLFN